ncbi:MAG TPA: folate-binding protein [Solirubrobacteraceae bacterium]|jgi:folate-binding protein YgfZ|nr:folate-binding protein [Solirubrobacteraceae bacterium]
MAAGDLILDTARLDVEYAALSGRCGLVDRSERGKLALSGADAKTFLAGQVTNDTEALAPGEGCYAAFLTHKGKMLGDLRILDVSPIGAKHKGEDSDSDLSGEELLLDTERLALQALFDMIRRFKIGYQLQLHKRTMERGLLSLIGPESARIAAAEALPTTEHANVPVEIDGIAALAARTDTGVDLICDSAATERLIEALCERGATAVSEQTAEIVRVEHGRPRYGADMDESTIPQEAGLNERAVSFTKGCYVGQETVARLYYRGKPNRLLRGLRLSQPSPAGAELRLGEKPVGRLSSAVLSPTFGPIGLGLVRREAQLGASVSVADGDGVATVVDLPFRA